MDLPAGFRGRHEGDTLTILLQRRMVTFWWRPKWGGSDGTFSTKSRRNETGGRPGTFPGPDFESVRISREPGLGALWVVE
jgi:hypothetical protein